MIDGKNNIKRYECTSKIATDQGDDYTTGCLRDYLYFKENCILIAIDLSKQQKFWWQSKSNAAGTTNATMVFILEEVKKKKKKFITRNCKSVSNIL